MGIEDIDLTVVLATLNEIDNLPRLCSDIDSILKNAKIKYQLLFVDDNSSDGTREFIIEYCNKNKLSKYIFNEHKKSTLIARYQGINHSDGKYIILMDSDLQHPPKYLVNIYNGLLENYDIVIASRYVKDGSSGNRKPIRGIISRGASLMAQLLLKSSRQVKDPVSCYIGFRKGLKLDIDEAWRGYEIGIFLRASNNNVKMKEIPYRFAERENGKSKVTSSLKFFRVYIIELLLAKRVEIRNYKTIF